MKIAVLQRALEKLGATRTPSAQRMRYLLGKNRLVFSTRIVEFITLEVLPSSVIVAGYVPGKAHRVLQTDFTTMGGILTALIGWRDIRPRTGGIIRLHFTSDFRVRLHARIVYFQPNLFLTDGLVLSERHESPLLLSLVRQEIDERVFLDYLTDTFGQTF